MFGKVVKGYKMKKDIKRGISDIKVDSG